MKQLVFLLVLLVFTLGCLFGGGSSPPPSITYVTPCNVVGSGATFRVNGTTLDTEVVLDSLSHMLVDDITSEKAAGFKKTYKLSCYWGANPGERKNFYYCNGSYVAPDIDDKGTITRKLLKSFKIGFSVQEYRGDVWVDMNGVRHEDESLFDLTVSSIDATCIVVL
jgi:hypothetical protein